MTKEEKIISITEATVAAYSNSPVWYKSSIIKYMNEFAKEQTTSLKAEVEFKDSEIERLKEVGTKATEIAEQLSVKLKSYEKRVESLQSQLAEKEKEFNFAKASLNHLTNTNTTLHNRLAEADKLELLNLISRLDDYFFCEKSLEEGEYEDLMDSTHKAINKHGNNI